MLTSSLDWARGTAYLWSMMWALSWGDWKAEAWNHLVAHSLTLSGGWCLFSPKTSAEAFGQNAYVPSMWPGLSHMWWLGSKRSLLREREPHGKCITLYDLALEVMWCHVCHIPSIESITESPDLRWGEIDATSQCRWQGSGRAYGTRNLAVPFLENIICHSIWAVYKFIDRGAPRMF